MGKIYLIPSGLWGLGYYLLWALPMAKSVEPLRGSSEDRIF